MRIKLEVPTSSTVTKMSSGQSDWSKRLESRRNNLKSKTRSYVPALKPTSRIDHTPGLKQPKLWSTAADLTLRQV
jgi:hypothetical protein